MYGHALKSGSTTPMANVLLHNTCLRRVMVGQLNPGAATPVVHFTDLTGKSLGIDFYSSSAQRVRVLL